MNIIPRNVPQLIDQLLAGKIIAQCSDAGMPSISDPGHELVKACIAADIPVIALPGPTAGLTALIASGLSPQPNLFMASYLEKRKSKRSIGWAGEPAGHDDLFMNHLTAWQRRSKIWLLFFGAERSAVISREFDKNPRGILARFFKRNCWTI